MSTLCTIACGQAQGPPPPDISLPETLKLSRLVDLTSEVTRQPYSYNPADLEATVTLRVPGGLTREQLPAFLGHVLASRGLTTVRTPGSPVLSVVKLEQAAGLASTRGSVRSDESPGIGALVMDAPVIREDDERSGREAGAAGKGAGGEVAAGASSTAIGGPAFVTELISPRHMSPKALADAVRVLLSKPGGSVTLLGDTNMLLVSDLAVRLAEVHSLLERIDVPDGAVTREVPLTFVSATQAAAVVTQLASKREAAGGRKLVGEVIGAADGASLLLICPPESEAQWLGLIAIADRREPAETRTYTPRYFAAKDVAKLAESVGGGSGTAAGADDRFKVVVDDLTGGLIVTATAAQHEKIAALMERLDSAERGPTPVRSFPVKNRPVAELLATLQQLIAAGALEGDGTAQARADVSAGAAQSSYRSPFPTATGEVAANGAGPVTTILPPANPARTTLGSSSAGGSPAAVRPPLSLTADDPTNTIIAIGEPRLLSQLEDLLLTLDVRQPQVMLEAILVSLTDSEALSLGVELEKLANIGDTTINLASLFGLSAGGPVSGTVAPGAGGNALVLSPGDFGVVIKALESINKGRSISNPKLLVTNNEQAVFSSVLQQPITQQTRTGSNDTTFSYGGSESAGTTISVKPQIAQGDHLVLTYSIKLSSFQGTAANAGLPPPKQENSVDSVATIPDGHTVVVGGLELITDSEGEARVPLLGEIPLIGELFKQRNTGQGRTRFYTFIRATVLRSTSFEDLKYLSANAAAGMGVDDGWPEVEPRVIR